MYKLKNIGFLLLALALMTGATQAAKEEIPEAKKEKPDATIQLSGGSVAAGLGYSWGKGTLTFKGKEHAISVNGLSLGKVGLSKATASGEVYNLKHLKDFDGNYTAHGAGMTLAGGRSAITMKNQNDVRVVLMSTTKGVDLTAGGAGVELKLKK